MQVTETLKDGLKRGYRITLTGAELDAKVVAKLLEAQPDVVIKGFRKGKVPLPILRKQFGTRILGDAMQDTIDGAVKSHFDATGERPAMQPKVEMEGGESWREGNDMVVLMTYEALPEVPAPDFTTVTLERLMVEADDAALAEALDGLAKSAPDYEDRPAGAVAEAGDQVVIDYKGSIDGVEFDGGTAEDYPLVLGSGSFIPGFEEQLTGAKAGATPTVNVTFPEDYGTKPLAGKSAVFACTVKAVRAPKPAAIDDAMAKKFGAESLDALKGQVKTSLEGEYRGAARSILKRRLLDALDKLVSFDLPPSLVEAEAGQIAHQLWHEEHPDHHSHDHDSIPPTDEHHALAQRRVRLGLLLAEVGKREKIDVTDSEMTQAILAQARGYPGRERQFFEMVQKNQNLQAQFRAPVFEEKVVDHILAQAQVSEKKVNRDELKAAVDALDEF